MFKKERKSIGMRKSTSYERAVAGLTPRDRDGYDAMIAAMSDMGTPWQFIGPNLLKEHFLPGPAMRAFLLRLKKLVGAAVDLNDAFIGCCRKQKFLGRRVMPKYITGVHVLGSAKNRESFLEYLRNSYPLLFRTPHDARDFLRRVINGEPLGPAEQSVTLHSHMIWCTWSTQSDDPFDFAKTSFSDEIRACLGLPASGFDTLVLFRYPRGMTGPLFRPTILDAETHEYFEPPPLSYKHGRTRPWPEAQLNAKLARYGVKPDYRPEAVHKPIVINNVVVEELR
jgi:hypothetical protein